MKKCVIAEKPSVAADYAKVLGCTKKEKGYYEGADYIVTSALGHLFTLKEPQEYDEKYKEWKLEDLPIIPERFFTKLIERNKSQYFIIKSLIEREDVSEIINGGDCGVEGELIQRWILLNTRTKKPIKRLWIDDLTEKEIRRGFYNLKEAKEFDPYYHAANVRAKIDWCLGMNFSRAYTTKIGRGGSARGGSSVKSITLSLGRCQTPILNIIVKRDLEIENFKTVPYYEVVADMGIYKAKFIDLTNKENGTRISNKSLAEKLVSSIRGGEGKVIKVKKENKDKRPPQLFNLTDLQKLMSNKYDFNEDKTLELAQRLYEHYKILSYPRTSSNHLSDNIAEEFKDILNIVKFDSFTTVIDNIGNDNINKVLKDKRFVDNKKVTDHYALIPTQNTKISTIYRELSEDERLLFNEVVMRFLSIFFDDYQYETTTIITNISGFAFINKGIIETNKGWKAIYIDDEEEEVKETINKVINEGDIYKIIDSKLLTNKTKEPPRYIVATILSIMQKFKIGTEATRANIINTLIKREYVTRDGKKFKSTQLGRDLIKSVNIEEIKSVELTAELEDKLNRILKNELTEEEVFNEAISFIRKNIEIIKSSQMNVIGKKDEVLGKCPKCKNGDIVKIKEFYGCTGYKEGCKFTIPGKLLEANITETQVKKILINGGKSGLIKFKYEGKEFKAKLFYDEKQEKITFFRSQTKGKNKR